MTVQDYHEEITHWICPADGVATHHMVEKRDTGIMYCAYCRLTAWSIKMDAIDAAAHEHRARVKK